jgi:hypothetical protein
MSRRGDPATRYTDFRERSKPPRLTCCRPRWIPFPSGWCWTHSRYCPAPGRRGQKVVVPTDAERIAPDDLTLPEPVEDDGPLRRASFREALRHPVGCRCETCEYLWAHADDDDDDGNPEPPWRRT